MKFKTAVHDRVMYLADEVHYGHLLPKCLLSDIITPCGIIYHISSFFPALAVDRNGLYYIHEFIGALRCIGFIDNSNVYDIIFFLYIR